MNKKKKRQEDLKVNMGSKLSLYALLIHIPVMFYPISQENVTPWDGELAILYGNIQLKKSMKIYS